MRGGVLARRLDRTWVEVVADEFRVRESLSLCGDKARPDITRIQTITGFELEE
jgi:hypothetical protein